MRAALRVFLAGNVWYVEDDVATLAVRTVLGSVCLVLTGGDEVWMPASNVRKMGERRTSLGKPAGSVTEQFAA